MARYARANRPPFASPGMSRRKSGQHEAVDAPRWHGGLRCPMQSALAGVSKAGFEFRDPSLGRLAGQPLASVGLFGG